MGYLLPERWLDFVTPMRGKATVHAAQSYLLQELEEGKLLLKLDFSNAFNSIWRDIMIA